jgi:very-short-patch-repair endonuclease
MDWRDRARSQAGAISRSQLARCAVSERSIDGLVARRDLIEVLPSVYAARSAPGSAAQREWAAILWSGGALSHASAARLWSIPTTTSTLVHVTVGDRRYRAPVAGVRLHRVNLDRDEVSSLGGRPVTTRPRTVVDLLRTERFEAARNLRDRALQLAWIDARSIQRSVSAQLGRTGNTQLRLLLQEIVAGAHAESERILHRILRRAQLTGWQPQYPVRLGTRTAFLDVAFPAIKLAIEVDGRLAHGDLSDRFDDDRARQNALVAAGWIVVRFTWSHLQDSDYVLSQIVQYLAA